MPRSPQREGETHNRQKCEGKTTPKLSLHEEMENVSVWPNGHAFWVLTCPKSQKRFSPNLNFIAHTLPIPMQ